MATPRYHARFFAHSGPTHDGSDWQPLALHLKNVGRMAGECAAIFGLKAMAETAGLLHDIGKYTDEFQRRIAGDSVRTDHSTHGAIQAVKRYGKLGHLLAYGIAGHHAGLANGIDGVERTALRDRLCGNGLPTLLDDWRNEIMLPEAQTLSLPIKLHSRERSQFQFAFLVRMLFSCLVDADFLDTEAFYANVDGKENKAVRNGSMPTIDALRDRLNKHLATFSTESEVNSIRADILRHVRGQAGQAPGLFSLTVPTGGGKTLTSLAFALDHAIRHGLRRVIYVIPFTSIVEQNAKVFREALGSLGDAAVLEHHSAFIATPSRDGPDCFQAREKMRLAMENWDAPIVVTTAVQFFESLFAARPSQCRKLHNIAGSVIILDEAQTLPLKLLSPTVAAIDELARNYRSSVMLCTATQPALEAPLFVGGLEDVRELSPEPKSLFRKLERVRIRHLGVLDDVALTNQLCARKQVLCIVNNRKHARALYEAIADLPGARHLSTLMCAKHRSAALAEIRDTLTRGKACRLVATSLIEAGVDISLPTVLRAEAGLDAIAQAAGRCNRNKEWPVDTSEVLVFGTASEDWAPPPELRQFAQVAQEILRQPQYHADPLSPEAIQAYFQKLYWQKGGNALDAHNLLGITQESAIDSLPMETLAAKFRMIEDGQVPIIIPYDKDARDLLESLRHAEKIGGLGRRLQLYLVQVPRKAYDALCQAGAVQPVAPTKWGEQFMELMTMDLYSAEFGLSWDDPTFIRAENCMW